MSDTSFKHMCKKDTKRTANDRIMKIEVVLATCAALAVPHQSCPYLRNPPQKWGPSQKKDHTYPIKSTVNAEGSPVCQCSSASRGVESCLALPHPGLMRLCYFKLNFKSVTFSSHFELFSSRNVPSWKLALCKEENVISEKLLFMQCHARTALGSTISYQTESCLRSVVKENAELSQTSR